MFLSLLAQAVAAATPGATAQQGVISYAPEFFAAQQPNSALDMLSRIPGFTVDYGASVRGFEGAAGNVLIDGGRPASKSDSLSDILARLPASQVARIDIVRGGAPGVDMQGKTVLANVIRKKGAGYRAAVNLSDFGLRDGRHLEGLRIEASGDIGPRKWDVSLRHGRGLDGGLGDGRGTRLFADGRPPQYADLDGEGDSNFYAGTAALETPLAGGMLGVNGRLYTDDFKGEEKRFYAAPLVEESVFLQDTNETEVGLRYTRPLGRETDIELVGLRQSRDRLVDNIFTDGSSSRFSVNRDTVETIARAVLKHRFTPELSLEAGGESAINTLDSRTRLTVDGAAQTVPAADVRVEEKRRELFAKTTWRPSDDWTLDGGLRYEFSTISSEGDVALEKSLRFLKPRLAATWAPSATRQLRLRVEREVGQLNFSDFVASGSLNSAGGVTAGNPDLDPEQAWTFEAALEQRFWVSGALVLTFRHSELADVIDRGPVLQGGRVFDRPTNIGNGTRDVLALSLSLPFDRLGMTGALLKGDITKRWSEVADPTTGEEREISGLRPLDWSATFSWDMPHRKMTWGVEMNGGFRESYYRFASVEDFKLQTQLKPFLEWKPRTDLNLRLELPNVTARDLRDTFTIYPGPRSAGGRPDVDDRHYTDTPGGYYVRVRKTFGA